MRNVNLEEWKGHQEFEKDFWGDCCNTYDEESKQIVYAECMGLKQLSPAPRGAYPCYDINGKRVVDIGGGPCSILLKCVNIDPNCFVVDPCDFPTWVFMRYKKKKINVECIPGESIERDNFCDEVWIYNTLQHTFNPSSVINNAMKLLRPAGILRIFEWVDIPESIGHPHLLKTSELEDWIGSKGTEKYINKNGAVGNAFFGSFQKKV